MIKKLKKQLKKHLNNKNIIDIFIIGSSLKNKLDFKDIENIIYNIKKELKIENLHIEPLFADNLFKENIFSSLIHEGFSIRQNKQVGELIGYKSFLLFIFSLEGLDNIDKVRFAQTLYGRNKKGILKEEGGKFLGKGAIIVPIEKEHIFRDIMLNFKVKFETKRIFIKD